MKIRLLPRHGVLLAFMAISCSAASQSEPDQQRQDASADIPTAAELADFAANPDKDALRAGPDTEGLPSTDQPSGDQPESLSETISETAHDAAPADSAAADLLAPADLQPDAEDSRGDTPDTGLPVIPAFPAGLPAADQLGTPHGFLLARTIVHLHSLFSHDACDNQPVLDDGQPNEACLQTLRQGLCTDRIDFALLTEHYATLTETTDFERLFLQREGDAWVDEDGVHAANAITCADGHRILWMPGVEASEDQFSVVGLTGHPVDGTPEEIEAAYKDQTPQGIERLHDRKGVLLAIHSENWTPDLLANPDLDSMELGNLHVLIAPDYRTQLGLDPGVAGLAFFDYLLHPAANPPGDLVFLEFHQRLPIYHEHWDTLLAQKMLPAFLGNDVHQNVLAEPLGDGDRPDSYRRMMKWYVNHLLVSDKTPAQARAALKAGRLYMVYEVLGSPVGFDFWVEQPETGAVWLAGETTAAPDDISTLELHATCPQVLVDDQPMAVPLTLRLYRVAETGAQLLLETTTDLDMPAPGPGRYRLEIDIDPVHLAPYLQGHEELLHVYPWIVSNPIEIP